MQLQWVYVKSHVWKHTGGCIIYQHWSPLMVQLFPATECCRHACKLFIEMPFQWHYFRWRLEPLQYVYGLHPCKYNTLACLIKIWRRRDSTAGRWQPTMEKLLDSVSINICIVLVNCLSSKPVLAHKNSLRLQKWFIPNDIIYNICI